MTRKEIHEILDAILDRSESDGLFGNVSFQIHFADGKVRQVTDVERTKTWRGIDGKAASR